VLHKDRGYTPKVVIEQGGIQENKVAQRGEENRDNPFAKE
jgi:hypothetical protein